MEILQTIWTALTTPNEILLNILSFPIYFIDAIVNMLLFITILDIKPTKKSKIIYVISITLIVFLSNMFIPDPYRLIIGLISGVLLVKFVLKVSILKSLIAVFIPIVLSTILELFIVKFCLPIFKISYEFMATVPLFRISFALSIYLIVYLLYRIIKYCKFNINLDNMTKKNKILFIINTILGIITIATQVCLIMFYSHKMPIGITIISIVSLLTYFFISFYSLLNTNKLDTTAQDLEEAQLSNKTLTLLHDSMRGFKHDFHNIVQGIGGYIESDDM